MSAQDPEDSGRPAPLESTAHLLDLVRGGDGLARERLAGRFLPLLRGWARGRLPAGGRDLSETDDLIQITLVRALNRVQEFEPRREGAFLAYLRTILLNAVREEMRRAVKRPGREPLDEALADPAPATPDESGDAIAVYESALDSLPEIQREAIILRLEFGYTYAEIAEAIGSVSSDAARMLVKRALVRLTDAMGPDSIAPES